jgi:serine/threonine-protein kinase
MTTPERWQEIDRIFAAALVREPAERVAFLDQACGGDEQLRKEVESLIAHDVPESMFGGAAVAEATRLLGRGEVRALAGEKIGPYLISKSIGAGGMGEVYLATDRLGRMVALKLLNQNFGRDKSGVARFQREAQTLLALNHPHIVTIYDIGEIDGTYYIASELVEGETLRQRFNLGEIAVSEGLEIAIQVATALGAAHEKGVVHRDIKPENVMIRHDGYIKVLDFGIAKLTEPRTATGPESPTIRQVNTSEGTVVGTAAYMSPEQARGLQVDARTDIFSLGVVIYEMVAAHLPFTGLTSSDVMASILNDKEAHPLARYTREVPAELERIVEKALRKDREQRYQSIKDMLLDLRSLKHKTEVNAEIERTGAPDRVTTNTESASAATKTTAPAAAPPTSSAEYIVSEIKRQKRGVAVALAAIIVLSVAGIAYYFYFARNGSHTAIDSIAVLPFANTSNDSNAEYLTDGISEALINSLTELPQLRVIARSTAFHYKGKDIDSRQVGRELNVRAVLMGRVRQIGDTLNIQVDLVDATTGAQLWGQEYERKVSDVLSVKQTIAREVTEKLRLKLSGEEQKRLTGRDTTNAEAYQFYLRGRYFWNKRTVEGLKKAIEQFQQAIDRDPNYALGYVGLADCYALFEYYAGVPASETLPKARAAADRALQIDDSLAEAHASSAYIYQNLWRWAEAEEEFKRAISLNPNYPTAHHWFARYLFTKRQFDDAMREIQQAQELDPLSPVISQNVALVYLLKNDLKSAIEQFKKTIELDPSFPAPHADLGVAYLKQQRYEEATAEVQKAVESSARASGYLGDLGYCYGVTGRVAEALVVLKELEEKQARHESIGQSLALVDVGLGNKDQAFRWLEKDFQQRSGLLSDITWRFSFEGLRSDPRYADLARRMGLTP